MIYLLHGNDERDVWLLLSFCPAACTSQIHFTSSFDRVGFFIIGGLAFTGGLTDSTLVSGVDRGSVFIVILADKNEDGPGAEELTSDNARDSTSGERDRRLEANASNGEMIERTNSDSKLMSVVNVFQLGSDIRSATTRDDVRGGGLTGLTRGPGVECCRMIDIGRIVSPNDSFAGDDFFDSIINETGLSVSGSLTLRVLLKNGFDEYGDVWLVVVEGGGTLVPFFIVHWLTFAKTSAVVKVGLSSSLLDELFGDGSWTKLTGKSMTRSGVCLKSPDCSMSNVSAPTPCCSPSEWMPDMTSARALSMSSARSSGVLSWSSSTVVEVNDDWWSLASTDSASVANDTSEGKLVSSGSGLIDLFKFNDMVCCF